jgi:hypothetical protein
MFYIQFGSNVTLINEKTRKTKLFDTYENARQYAELSKFKRYTIKEDNSGNSI